ncbi:MAG: SMC-Scp complex subunit ScpB, partial [Erysipelotrichaceae bacterium]
PGKPFLYEITEEFMDAFKLESLKELPDLPDYKEEREEELFEG